MRRQSEADHVAEFNESAALGYFDEVLARPTDLRRAQGKRYPLRSGVAAALMTMVCGRDDACLVEKFSLRTPNQARREWSLPAAA